MRQWTMTSPKRYEIDTRTREMLIGEIRTLAASYVPEWQFDTEHPDIGSVLALLFTDQFQESLKRYNLTLERDYVELINMLGISLRPAVPAHSLVQLSLVSETVSGVQLKAHARLLGEAAEDETLIFEVAHGIYITQAKPVAAFMTAKDYGSIRPLFGSFPCCRFIEESGEDETAGERPERAAAKNPYPFTLFDMKGSSYGVYGLTMYHPHLFDVEENEILMELEDGEDVFAALESGELTLSYYGAKGFVPVEHLSRKSGSCMSFTKDQPCRRVTEEKNEYSVLLLSGGRPVTEELSVKNIRFASRGKEQPAALVWNGNTELAPERFLPFGETMGLYDEVYIGHASYFSKPGANVTLRFTLSFGEHLITLPKAQEDASLKIIKRKPKKDYFGTVAQVFAEEISFEYFDGRRWRRLICTTPTGQLFYTDKGREAVLGFSCPADWRPSEVAGGELCCIRMQLVKADNCYYQPANHHYPIVSGLTISYSYEQQYENPHRLYSFCGSDRLDVTGYMTKSLSVPVLRRHKYRDDALYLCFDRRMEDGPVSIMFQVEDLPFTRSSRIEFYYSVQGGWERLKLIDYTNHFSHTGTVLFMPPGDFARRVIEGQGGYWLKIREEALPGEKGHTPRPTISNIAVNVAEVDNIETLPLDDYYIDAVAPDMSFALNARNILSVEVWVNETELHSDQAKRARLRSSPGDTYAQYNFLGDIEQFYVRWQEVDNFDRSGAGDRHFMVDRMNNRLHFGDGVHVQIPRNTEGVAFRVRIRCCDGEGANLDPGQIRESAQNLMFIDEIKNPIRSYGGMNMETMEGALHRGTALLNGRGRLITQTDYERAVLAFSSNIMQVKAVVGQKRNGTPDPSAISLVVLMKDFRDGSFSFVHMRDHLREYLAGACELSVEPDSIYIVEPVFVRVSVEAWMDVLQGDDSFEVQNHLIRVLDEYLNPLTNSSLEIGQMVSRSQLELRLNMEKKQALVRRMMATAAYTDETGVHETDLERMDKNPFVAVTGGRHRIHFNGQHT